MNIESNYREYKNYETVSMGQAPEVLLLSELEFNKIYVYDLELDEYNNFKQPEFSNDTEFPILDVWFKFQEDEYFTILNRQFKMNKSLENLPTTMSVGYVENPKLYIVIEEMNPNKFLEQNSSRCFHLSNCGFKNTIELYGTLKDYIYNDTDKTYILESDSMYIDEPKIVTVLPGEIVNVDNNVSIVDVK